MSVTSDFYIRFVPENEKETAIEGECLDEMHPGHSKIPHPDTIDGAKVNPGWFQFTSLTFVHAVKDIASHESAGERKTRLAAELEESKITDIAERERHRRKRLGLTHGGSDDSERQISFSKRVDRTTSVMWESYSYTGKTFKKVEVEACRTGGVANAPKIPFVRLIFEENIRIKSVTMEIEEDALPVENITFSYDKVRIESIWTDNETGKRCVSKPRAFGWDFTANEGKGAEWT